jgi:hypothetical protein
MKYIALKILVSISVLFLAVGGCSGDSGNADNDQFETTAVSLSISFPQTSNSETPSFAVLGTYDDIDTVYLDVTQEVTGGTYYHLQDHPLVYSAGTWSSTIDNLPVSIGVAFTIKAFDNEPIEIFSGNTQTILSGDGGSVTVNLAPIDDTIPNVIPSITKIEVPSEVIRNSNNEAFNFYFKGNSSETLTFDITADAAGNFTPSIGSIVMSGAGTATQISTLNAPESEGTYNYKVTLTNSQGNYVRTGFPVSVVAPSTTTNNDLSVFISPVVATINGERNGADIVWTADVIDDGPQNALTYLWEYSGSGGFSFVDPLSNPVVLQNYSPSVSGTITLTVTDGDGGETSIGFHLAVNQFPVTFTQSLQYQLPDTNQTLSFTDTFGEDADYSIHPIGYTDNSNGTITDNNTLLTWEQSDADVNSSWTDALNYCSGLTLGGHNDWRLPSIQELKDLTYFKSTTPYIDIYYFLDVEGGTFYWSGSSATDPALAMVLKHNNGLITQKDKTTNSYRYRCVRGDTLISGSFNDNGDGTVTDLVTDLMWQQNETSKMTWDAALTYCTDLSLGEFDDWRLPNLKELYTLVDFNQTPTIDPIYFPDAFSIQYWTSTGLSATKSRLINFLNGVLSNLKVTRKYNARCVRNSQ